MSQPPVCLVMGAGAGIGGTVGGRFAAEGYHAVLCRRSNQAGLDVLVDDIKHAGGQATGFICNAVQEGTIEEVVTQTEQDIGPIDVVIFNLGAQTGNQALEETSLKNFEVGWRLATFALFRTAKAVLPLMAERGKGAMIVTSATAAMRGNPGQTAHASAMSARRILCQSLHAEYGPRGIHIAHVLVDGLVDAPDTTGKMLGAERFQTLRETRGLEHDGLVLPDKVADTYWHIAQQHKSTWTFEMDLRPHNDLPWWNG